MSDPWIDRLSAYLDNELTPDERAACEAHVQACAECHAALVELEAVVHGARHAPVHAPVTDLWPSIEARLSHAPPLDVARGAEASLGKVVPWTGRRVTLSLPQLALAASLLMAISAGVSWLAANRGPATVQQVEPAVRAVSEPFERVSDAQRATFADAQFDAAVSDLERILAEHRNTLDPRTVRVLERNLKTIDDAIHQARAALDADPANPFLNSHLVDARQRKLDLLRRAAMLAEGGN